MEERTTVYHPLFSWGQQLCRNVQRAASFFCASLFGSSKALKKSKSTGVHSPRAAAVQKKKKILICTNHSYMLYQFRRELIEQLVQDYEVVLSMPFVGHETDFEKMGCRCVATDLDRRSINPVTDFKLLTLL